MLLSSPLALILLVAIAQAEIFNWVTENLVSGVSNPYLVTPFRKGGPTQYLVFHAQLRSNYREALERCQGLGGDLADVEAADLLTYLEQRVHEPVYIGSFLGSTWGDNCLALYPGGAIAGKTLANSTPPLFLFPFVVPDQGCLGQLASLCEVPVYGSGTLHLDLKPDFKDDEDGKAVKLEDMAVGDSQKGRKPAWAAPLLRHDPRQPAPPAASSPQPTRTLTIFGSIETNPAKPCCQCC